MSAFSLTHSGSVAHLRFTNPKTSNAMDADFWANFQPAIQALSQSGTVRALVLSAEGKNFCSGMDISMFASGIPTTDTPEAREAFPPFIHRLQATLSCLEATRFPVIAAIQGACIGGGLDLVSACDIRIAASDAYFRIEETNIGMMADLGSLQRLPKLMPEGVVREMAYLGSTLGAARGHAVGFINALEADAESALKAAMEAAERIASKAPLAVAGSKAAITYAREHSTADALNWASTMQTLLWNPEDIQKAVMARAKGEAPAFVDLAKLRETLQG